MKISERKMVNVIYISTFQNNHYIYCVDYEKGSKTTQPAFTCSKLTIETLEQGVKYVKS